MITDYDHGLTFALIIFLVCLFFKYIKSRNPKGKESIFAIIWYLSIVIIGFILFFIGAIYKQKSMENFNYIMVIMNSLTGVMKMFMFDFRDELVKALANDNLIYRIAIFLCFVSAGIWTQVMVTRLFLGSLINGVKIFLHSHGLFRSKHTHYIIIGCGKKAELFLTNLKKEVCSYDITLITGKSTEKAEKYDDYYRSSIAKGFTVINGKADTIALENAGLKNTKRHTIVVAITDNDEQNVTIADIVTRKIFKIIFPDEEYTNLEFQRKAINAINFIPKSDYDYKQLDEESRKCEDRDREKYQCLQNHILYALGQDKGVIKKTFTKGKRGTFGRVKLEARIMYSFIERTEYFSFAENAFGKVDFINPYELQARNFFWKHPITDHIPHLIDYYKARLMGDIDDESGLILKSDKSEYRIKNIFIGFGATNYQMLRSSVITGQLLGCNYSATVFDEAISLDKTKTPAVRQSMFMNQAPGLFGEMKAVDDDYFPLPKESYKIEFEHGNVLTKYFYKTALNKIRDNDFTAIYIAVGNDQAGIETACELRQTLCESGIPLDNIHIYLKINERSVLNDNSIINNVKNVPLDIECFGFEDENLSKDQVINVPFDSFAKTITNKSHNIPWEYLSEFERDSNRSKVLELHTMLGFLGFTTRENVPTDAKAENLYRQRYGLLDKRISRLIAANARIDKSARLEYPDFDNGKISDTARNNLARGEHLRWNTFHLVNGWTMKPKTLTGAKNGEDDLEAYFKMPRDISKLGRKNRLTKQHACITTFEGLVDLRRWQAEKAGKVREGKEGEEFDTLYHDFTLLDGIIERLQETKSRIVLKAAKEE
jgi:hypothetical protein